jgi:hypothetical protein
MKFGLPHVLHLAIDPAVLTDSFSVEANACEVFFVSLKYTRVDDRLELSLGSVLEVA